MNLDFHIHLRRRGELKGYVIYRLKREIWTLFLQLLILSLAAAHPVLLEIIGICYCYVNSSLLTVRLF